MSTRVFRKLTIYLFAFLFIGSIVVLLSSQSVYAANSADCTTSGAVPGSSGGAVAIDKNTLPACQSVDVGALGFRIPSLGDILTFAIRAFFAIAGIAALFYMLLGAFGWVTSGGDKDAIGAAREKIQAAVLGMIMIVAVLAVIWTLEQVIFKRRICLGLSCPVTLPGLIETTQGQFCCVCIVKDTGALNEVVNGYKARCDDLGVGVPL